MTGAASNTAEPLPRPEDIVRADFERLATVQQEEDFARKLAHLKDRMKGVPLSLHQWAEKEIEPKKFLLGEVFSTTTRAILSADTGLGKTHFGFAIGLAMAAGEGFCHWQGHGGQPRVLVIDGEMSAELVQERLADAERRLDHRPEGFFCLCKETVADMPPLDTEEGHEWLSLLIAHLGYLDFIIFDNLSSLTVGGLTDEEGWLPMETFNKSLTALKIGILWINHTGHDKTRDYGTKRRQWQLDTVMVAQKIEDSDADIAFKLEFTKARQRKPSNRADYETVDVILQHDQWATAPAKAEKRKTYGKNQKTVLEALDYVLATAGKPSNGTTGLPTSATIASLEIFKKHCLAKMPQGTDRRREGAFKEAFESLCGPGGPIGKYDEYVWKAAP